MSRNQMLDLLRQKQVKETSDDKILLNEEQKPKLNHMLCIPPVIRSILLDTVTKLPIILDFFKDSKFLLEDKESLK